MARRNTTKSSNNFMDFLSFVAIIIIGIGLIFIAVLKLFELQSDLLTQIVGYVRNIIQVLAIAFVAYNSYFYAKGRKQWLFVVWLIAVIMVIATLVISYL